MARRRRKRNYGSGSVYRQKGRHTFSIKYPDNGVIVRDHGYQTEEMAQAVLDEAVRNRDQRRGKLPRRADQIPTLSVLVEKWLENRENTHEDVEHDRGRWTNHLLPDLGKLRPDDVDAGTITTLINKKFKDGLSSGTVCLIVRLLSTIYSDLVESHDATINPVFTLPKKTKRLLKSDHDPETVPFLRTMVDIGLVLSKMEEPFSVAFAIGVYSGPRDGEILGLDWNQIDIPNRKIRLSQQVTNNRMKPLPKDKASRLTIIPNALVPILEEWKAKTGGVGLLFQPAIKGWSSYKTSGGNTWTAQWLDENGNQKTRSGFTQRADAEKFAKDTADRLPRRLRGGGGRPGAPPRYMTSRSLNKALQRALSTLELGSLTWYEATRHTFASQWVLNGGSLEVLQKLMGHSSISTTQRYAHLKLDTFSKADLDRMAIPALPPEKSPPPLETN